jgi:hypothetical protein
MLATWEMRTHRCHLVATRSMQHTPDRLIRHAIITCDVTERFPLLDTLDHSCPCRGRDLEAEDQLRFEGGKTETPAPDGRGQMQKDHLAVKK